MRDTLKNISFMVVDKQYKKPLSVELQEYYAYLRDAGHCIMCVTTYHVNRETPLVVSEFEIPIPVKYVLEHGYKKHDGFLEVNAEYNSEFGLDIEERYFEY